VRSFPLKALALSFLLVSCAQQPKALWLKPGSGADEFSKAKYACLQQSQQPTSAAYLNRYGGVASSNIVTNGGLYDACMNSQGWILTPVTDVKSFNDALRPIAEERREACSRADLQPIYQKKMPCKVEDTSPQQLSDRSKASNEEKNVLLKWQSYVQESNGKVAEIFRKYDTKNGEAVASAVERRATETNALASQLSNGSITWGEFNTHRVELNKRFEEAEKMALTY
jgi:hypothetical protein